MIQFSKPRRALNKSLDQYRRHEVSARDALAPAPTGGRSGTPSRFDSTFFRTHDSTSYIPSDLQSQATYSSGLPSFAATSSPFSQAVRNGAAGKRGGYASSVISQDVGTVNDSASAVGSAIPSSRASSIAFSQSDRLRRRMSQSSLAGASDMGSMSTFDYKSQDDAVDLDDVRSQYSASQSGVTEF